VMLFTSMRQIGEQIICLHIGSTSFTTSVLEPC